MAKRYDRAYFDKWYRSRFHRVIDPTEVRRKAALAVSTAEYFLERSIRTVLDIGCGEGAWLPRLREMRPRLAYTGVDPSEYVTSEFGKSRNIRKATFGDLPSLKLKGPFDLIVCSDVLHYIEECEIREGMWEIARLLEGIALLEVLTKEDDVKGDLRGFIRRPAAWYRRMFSSVGLTPVGPYCWLSPSLRDAVAALELP